MTDVNKNSQTPVTSVADARRFYAPPAPHITGQCGLEVEMPLYRVTDDGIMLATPADMTALLSLLRKQGLGASEEASSVFEYAGPARLWNEAPALVEKAAADLAIFNQAIMARGLKRAPFPVMPTTTIDDALAQLIDRERLRIAVKALKEIGTHDHVAIPLLTAGVQVSFSPRDNEQLYRMLKRAYAITPLLYALQNSDSGFAENDPVRRLHHQRGVYYEGFEQAGGLAETFLDSRTADEFIDKHIVHVMTTRMFFAYGKDGTVFPATKERPLNFQVLTRIGLNTQANYELAETFLYHDIKICNLRDEQGVAIGKRLEVRAADSGEHQPFTTLLLTAALIPDGPTAERLDALLVEYGFTGNPRYDASLYRDARKNAVHHNGHFMNVPFGHDPKTDRPRLLSDFAKDIGRLIAAHYQSVPSDDSKTHHYLAVLLGNLQNGHSDAMNYRQTLGTLDAARTHLRDLNMPLTFRTAPAYG